MPQTTIDVDGGAGGSDCMGLIGAAMQINATIMSAGEVAEGVSPVQTTDA